MMQTFGMINWVALSLYTNRGKYNKWPINVDGHTCSSCIVCPSELLFAFLCCCQLKFLAESVFLLCYFGCTLFVILCHGHVRVVLTWSPPSHRRLSFVDVCLLCLLSCQLLSFVRLNYCIVGLYHTACCFLSVCQESLLTVMYQTMWFFFSKKS